MVSSAMLRNLVKTPVTIEARILADIAVFLIVKLRKGRIDSNE